MRGDAIRKAFARARSRVGVKVTFHYLRHTGQTLAASTGASLADLKKRLGHALRRSNVEISPRCRRPRQGDCRRAE
ncbi:hypothetical protein ABZV58_10440 [Nocardia sp. NPDC004654]|uniref:hypothetical protein n=1 Tax=Nocardia sp. NPDC004654 TaxID=3154776 RepID=UPI0033B45E67